MGNGVKGHDSEIPEKKQMTYTYAFLYLEDFQLSQEMAIFGYLGVGNFPHPRRIDLVFAEELSIFKDVPTTYEHVLLFVTMKHPPRMT